ncbi:LacI family DNA-binding transcriptional regulator [Numidum massiliense]|uniref:LacI family DNA-binding transcriptional regulator n=1 Tax=Numidum massiliense TaxID=1522315 RepID=UPI0006D55F59|nr:LacI family DNA-binding transcriptional regulator [Numidum massiliense]
MGKKVTMQHIADDVGVSKYAVSRALAGKEGVSEATRARVIAAAVRLGYRVDPVFLTKGGGAVQVGETAAKGTKVAAEGADTADGDKVADGVGTEARETAAGAATSGLDSRGEQDPTAAKAGQQFVTVVIPGLHDSEDGAFFWGRILTGISEALRERQLGIIVVSEVTPHHFAQIVNPQGTLGMIGVGSLPTELLLEASKAHIPFVLVDHEDPLVACDTVFANNFDSMYRLTHYLIGLGYRSLQFVGDIHGAESFFNRWLGFRTCVEAHGIALRQNEQLMRIATSMVDPMRQSLAGACRQLALGTDAAQDEMPPAFVCANDATAIHLLEVLSAMDIRVPETCAVTGFDDIEANVPSEPRLTTVRVANERLGERAVELLLWRLSRPDAPTEKVLVAGELIVRDSTGELQS